VLVGQAVFTRCSRMMMSIQRLPQPVIAAVNGLATGAGNDLTPPRTPLLRLVWKPMRGLRFCWLFMGPRVSAGGGV
jgi:hypothetical protein